MPKKITIKEIAEKAGVSTATVSYVLNGRDDQKISEQTKTKILQISHLLGYAGASPAAGATGNIGLFLHEPGFALAEAEQLGFAARLSEALGLAGYRLVLLPPSYTGRLDYVDAVICCGVSEGLFHAIGRHIFIPQIAVDMVVEDEWIFKVYNDFAAFRHEPGSIPVSLEQDCAGMRELICEALPGVKFVGSFEEIDRLTAEHPGAYFTALGDALYEYLKSKTIRARRCSLTTQYKISKIIECLRLGISHEEVGEHVYLV